MKMGQTNMHNYMKPLLERIESGQIDPSYIIRIGSRSIRRLKCIRYGVIRRNK